MKRNDDDNVCVVVVVILVTSPVSGDHYFRSTYRRVSTT